MRIHYLPSEKERNMLFLPINRVWRTRTIATIGSLLSMLWQVQDAFFGAEDIVGPYKIAVCISVITPRP